MRVNWIHLDCKGVLPGENRLIAWVHWLSERGFNGIVLEYEDRMPWRTWPGTHRPGLTLAQWKNVIGAARACGMEVAPLIQTHGHLEWLLKHPRWEAWRENGCYNEICPQCDGVMPAIESWLDEVVEIHGRLTYLHIGGDETWNLVTCPQCRTIADASADGKLHVYLTHLQRVADAVVARGMRPMIWADVFCRESRMDMVEQLPREVVLCDWQYTGVGPWPTVNELGKADSPVFGASAVRCNFDLAECQSPLGPRVENILAWHEQKNVAGLIHTVWGRGRSLLPQYGPWEGWLPAMIAAGKPDDWSTHLLAPWVERFDEAITGTPQLATELADALENATFDDEWFDAMRRWWVLALRWRVILMLATANMRTACALETVHDHIGVDPDYVNHRRAAHRRVCKQVENWQLQVRQYFADRDLDGVDEFLSSRTAFVLNAKPADWAENIIAECEPRTAR